MDESVAALWVHVSTRFNSRRDGRKQKQGENDPHNGHFEGGVRKVRKPQNRTKNNKKPQYRIEIYRNTETAGCPRQDLQSF